MTGELKSTPSMIAGAVPTVGELFRICAQVHSTSTAIEYQGRQISYGQLLDRVQRVTAMLASYGLRRGDRVALRNISRSNWRLQISAS
jgi:fatty-acyl-CoA synthase